MSWLQSQLRQITRWRKDRQQLSKPLRRKRLRRLLLGGAIGVVWSFCIMVLMAQTGLMNYFGRLPWFVGIAFGIAVSVGFTLIRLLARRLRVKLIINRIGGLVLLLTGLAAFATISPPAGAQIQLPDCNVTISGEGLDGPGRAAETTPDNPVVVNPNEVDVIIVDWNLPDGVVLTGHRWWIRTDIAGFEYDLVSGQGENGKSRYQVTGIDKSIVPGTYRVIGEFEDVCQRQSGYVRVTGSPFSNPIGQLAGAGAALSTLALALVYLTGRFDLWSFTTADRVTVEIVHPHTGKTVRGPLLRGERYDMRISTELPDPITAYDGLPGPIEVLAGVLGVSAAPGLSSFDPRQGMTETRIRFDVPGVGTDHLKLNVDLSVGGEVIESIQMIERAADHSRFKIERGLGSVIYRAGDFSARHLCNIVPVDTTLMIHGDSLKEFVEVWTLASREGVRVSGRQRMPVDELQEAATRYRGDLQKAIGDWSRSTTSDDSRLQTLRALARSGSVLRERVLGDGVSGSPVDAVVLVTQDAQATDAMTFPWAGLYEGRVDVDNTPSLCTTHDDPERCDDHDDDVICPNRFWGFRHELAWPNGWAPGPDEGPSWRIKLQRLFRRSTPDGGLIPSRMHNRVPLDVISVVAPDFTNVDRLHEVLEGRPAIRHAANTLDDVEGVLAEHAESAEVVYLLAHSEIDAQVSTGADTSIFRDTGLALKLDHPLDGKDLSERAGANRFQRGPLVFVNACDSGVIGLNEHHSLLDAFKGLGARAVIVTETRVTDTQAPDAANAILKQILDGERVGRALLLARRGELADSNSLSMLAYSYYGPAGLKLGNPLPSSPPAPTADMAAAAVR